MKREEISTKNISRYLKDIQGVHYSLKLHDEPIGLKFTTSNLIQDIIKDFSLSDLFSCNEQYD